MFTRIPKNLSNIFFVKENRKLNIINIKKILNQFNSLFAQNAHYLTNGFKLISKTTNDSLSNKVGFDKIIIIIITKEELITSNKRLVVSLYRVNINL